MFTARHLVAALYGLLVASESFTDARHLSRQQLRQRQIEAAERFELRTRAPPEKCEPGVKNITFTNPKASGKVLSMHS